MTTRNDVYIAVICLNGMGESKFIRLCTGQITGEFSIFLSTWSSYTKQIRAWHCTHQGQRIHLIDTSGLNEFDMGQEIQNFEKWLKKVGRVGKNGVGRDPIILLRSTAEDPATRLENKDFISAEQCYNQKPLSRTILTTTKWGYVNLEKGVGHKSRLKRVVRNLSNTRFRDNTCILENPTEQSCSAVLDMLLEQINSDIQDRSVEQTAKHQGEINASKQKTASSKRARATDEAEEKRYRSNHAAATKYEEEITALKQQILNLEKANQAVNAENERYHAAMTASTTQAARTQEYENQIEALTTELDERKEEVISLKAYIAEAERTATGYWGDVEIPPIPYSLEPPRQASD